MKVFLILGVVLMSYSSKLYAVPVADGFDFPVGKPNATGYAVTGWDYLEWTGSVYHPGEDWNGSGGGNTDLGDPVYAAASGTVVEAGNFGAGWGNIVEIEHLLPNGTRVWTIYAHLDQIRVSSGDVARGQQIGTIGRGYNNEYTAHLHFEVRKSNRSASAWVTGMTQATINTLYWEPTAFVNSNRNLAGYSLQLYSAITLSPNPIVQGQPVRVYGNFSNTGTANFSGDWAAHLLNSDGSYRGSLGQIDGATLSAGFHYTTARDFFTGSNISSPPGGYKVGLFYRPTGGTAWTLIPQAGFTNPINVTITGGPSDDHGNTTGTATVVAVNSSVAGNIETLGDVDYFRINLASAGNLVINTTGGLDTHGYLYNSSGGLLLENDDDTDLNFRLSLAGAAAGTYYVKVEEHGNSATGAYGLQVSYTPPSTLSLGDTAESFGSGGGNLNFAVNSNTSWTWAITGNTGNWVSISEASPQNGSQQFSYTVAANTSTTARNATITFSASGVPSVTHVISQAGAVPDDHGNTTGTATVVAVNSSVAGNIETLGDVDYFRINLASAGNLVINTTGGLDTHGYLYNSSGGLLLENDDDTDLNFRLSLAGAAAGTYYVKVEEHGNSATGAYSLQVALSQSSPNLSPFTPPGWSGAIVASHTTGTNTDQSGFTTLDPIYVDWSVRNNGSGGTSVTFYSELYLNNILQSTWNTPGLPAGNYTWVMDYSLGNLPAGTHTVRIKTDSSGLVSESDESDNEFTKTFTVSLPPDVTAPSISITTPSGNGTIVPSSSFTVAGNASDNVAVTAVFVRVNGGAWANATGTTSWSANVTLAPGGNTIEAYSRDAANNLSTIASRTITYTPPDTSLPSVAISSPTAGSTTYNDVTSISGTATDNIGVTAVQTRANGGTWYNASLTVTGGVANWSLLTVVLVPGVNTLEARAYDAAGNVSSTASRTVTYVPLAAPTGVSASDGTSTAQVTVIWGGAAGAVSYSIHRNTLNTIVGATQIASGVVGTSYNDTSAAAGTPYYYWVQATTGISYSPFSASDSGYRQVVNTAPTISDIPSQTINEDGVTGALAFTVADGQTAGGALTVAAVSNNTALVPNANIVIGGSGANRTVTVSPLQNQNGTATITLTVTDAGNLTASGTFLLTVNAVNDAPTISAIGNQTTAAGSATATLPFTIGDIETAAASLTVGRASSNTTLVPTANIVLGGAGASRTVTITPAAGQSGTCTITLTVGDGALSTPMSFLLTVSAPPPAFRISSMRRTGTNGAHVELKFLSESGAVYRVQKSPTMATGTWTDAGLSANGTGAELTVTVPNVGLSGRYYFRVVKQ